MDPREGLGADQPSQSVLSGRRGSQYGDQAPDGSDSCSGGRTARVVQRLRAHAPAAGGWGSTAGQGT